MRKPMGRRLVAYILDILLVSVIVTAFSYIKFLNPKFEEYNKYSEEYESYIQELSMNNPTAVLSDEKATELAYNVSYFGVYTSIISLVITFLYFCIFQYYTNGKTLGKLVMGIEVTSTDNDRLKLSQVIIRSAIVDSILTSSLSIICLLFLSKTQFLTYSRIIEFIDLGLVLLCIGIAVYRDDGVGLHDKLAHTRVIYTSEKENIIKEATVTEKNKTKKIKKEAE